MPEVKDGVGREPALASRPLETPEATKRRNGMSLRRARNTWLVNPDRDYQPQPRT